MTFDLQIIAVDPDGSSLALPRELNKNGSHFYEVEGIGYDFDVTTCEKRYVDRWYKSFDKPSLECARRLIREEGFLCGGSSGAAFHYAVQALRDFGLADDPSKRCVVLLPDGIRNYMYACTAYCIYSYVSYICFLSSLLYECTNTCEFQCTVAFALISGSLIELDSLNAGRSS